MNEPILSQATSVYEKNVSQLRLARYYIESEIPRITHTYEAAALTHLHDAIEQIADLELWRILEALSYTYRINGVFKTITNKGFDWFDLELPIDAIQLTKLNPTVNKLVYSATINRSPIKLAEYLKVYFATHPTNDPDGLNEFRPTSKPINHTNLYVVAKADGSIGMLDGTHRLIALAMAGCHSIRAFAAVPNGKVKRGMVGDSTFETLKALYARSRNQQEREAIMITARALLRTSTDGKKAIATYWIQHGHSSKVREAGQELLKRKHRALS